VDLTRVLKEQHAAGRALTAEILKHATPESLKDEQGNQQLVKSIQRFIRMYRPHEAHEDTVLFPAFHSLFTEAEFDKLGDRFEKKEEQMLGKAGFEGTLNEVAELEKTLGIYDLSLFTPRA
jgi:hemerythrin-like domain-containing protein